eukprot:6181223-Pleurochrysis_carterae.AAC.1
MAAAQWRRSAASTAVFAVVRCLTQLAEPRLCTSRYFLCYDPRWRWRWGARHSLSLVAGLVGL